MATHKSAEKRARQSIKRNARNNATVGGVRTFEKKLRTAIAAGDAKAAQAILKDFTSKITKAATKGALHKKTAARKVGRLATRVQSLGSK